MNRGENVGIGLFGFGNIGAGVVRTLAENRAVIRRNLGFDLELRRIVDVDIETDRGIPVDKTILSKDKDTILADPGISIVIELIGGAGIAKTLVEKALTAGKSVVSANKELLAKHGPELHALAAQHGARILYEAAVGGGIPILTPMLTGLRANRILRITGIVNGTTNYILTQMRDTGADFADILKEAQRLGFAEADPTNDIEGFDAAYKTAILCSAGFGKRVDVTQIHREGISKISTADMNNARDMGFTIKLLSVSEDHGEAVSARVHPALVPLAHPLAHVNGVLNAIYLEGDPIGPLLFMGQGAGPSATSSAVLGDVIALATDTVSKTAPDLFQAAPLKSPDQDVCPFYVRMTVDDRTGVLAEITSVFAAAKVSINTMTQHDAGEGRAEIIWLTHPAPESGMKQALQEFTSLACVQSVDAVIRVLFSS